MEIFVVDAFTDRPFAGNPAGVVLLAEPRDDDWMQRVAAELKHEGTAFVTSDNELRWFSPTRELELCGHATLAAAHVLGGEQKFTTRSGVLTCVNDDGWVRMDFPADPSELTDPPIGLAAALPHATIKFVARGRFDYLIELGSAAEVRSLRPDVQGLAQISSRGVIVTAAGDGEADVVSRCFYPAVGIPEDSVTGSAHCTLASYWVPRLQRADLLAEQASPRGGFVRATLAQDRVLLSGQAVTVLRGRLNV
ncbi:PhzF family phenazine biosynthesis protein [Lentzea aerocolonigenes]|uniref:PhzF family phenazine biosynthesis protein n=1 Tax=Lentzea aerocolonigenes TaxID=68170 RepID=UPI0004C378A2|nr:PhzF family phenazine biosynthesis protein [Lentzea aerocolonigenes]